MPPTKISTKKKAKKDESKLIVLLDAHAIIHRAYHALPDFASAKGEPTGALYGICTMLLKIVNDLEPDYVIGAFDLPQPTYRHAIYKEYKAGRKEADDDLVAQIIRSRDVFKAFSIPQYAEPGFEADDVLGTIVKMLKDEDIRIVIASGDMDTLQLIDDKKVQVYTLKKGIKDTIMYDEDGVKERFGFGPELLPDYKGLRGDPSDNIPGIRGIGDKTASILIQKFGRLEDLFAALKKDKNKLLEAGIKARIIELLEAGEKDALFSKSLATIRRDAPISFEIPEKSWKESVSVEAVKKLFQELEFKTLGARVEELINGKPEQGALLSTEPQAPEESVDSLEFKKISIALWVLDSNITDPSLDDIRNWAGKSSFDEAKKVILDEIRTRKLTKVYEEIEMPLLPVLDRMEKKGIKIDIKYLKELSEEYHKELSRLEKSIWKHAGEEFNINSPKQLGDILFDKMGIAVKNQKKTAGGARSTRESELEKMKDLHPIISDILEYRVLQKLLSTYIDSLPHLIGEDGRIHTTFLPAGSTTGRMASQNPNLQNIPIKNDLGKNIRNAFIAEKGFVFVDFDYSQIELRVAAFLSADSKLLEIFQKDRDIHTEVAAQVFGVPTEKVDHEMRRKAKVINFGILYGMGVNALKQNLGTDRAAAQTFYDTYFSNFSGLAEYLEKVKADAKASGYTETFFGRRRYFPGLQSKLQYLQAMAERMALNAPIQGTQADIVKIAMRKIDDYIQKNKLQNDVFMLLQVHDELLFEVREDLVEKIAPKIREIMESVIPAKEIHGVVCKANASVGESWGSVKKIL